jgi:ATP-dependent Clp protease adaptor protein ClpS
VKIKSKNCNESIAKATQERFKIGVGRLPDGGRLITDSSLYVPHRSAMSARLAANNSAVVDQPSVGTETVVRPKAQKKPKSKLPPRYHVVLWDDPIHTYDYVIEMMQKLFHHSAIQSLKIAKEVDASGRAICFTTSKEVAELKRDQIQAYGNDPMSSHPNNGSMSASIEPAGA